MNLHYYKIDCIYKKIFTTSLKEVKLLLRLEEALSWNAARKKLKPAVTAVDVSACL